MLGRKQRFEYGVILNGSQTTRVLLISEIKFEYGVILNGSQTVSTLQDWKTKFEYGVILNGSQTNERPQRGVVSLSMVLFWTVVKLRL